jgi:hypothetical protein
MTKKLWDFYIFPTVYHMHHFDKHFENQPQTIVRQKHGIIVFRQEVHVRISGKFRKGWRIVIFENSRPKYKSISDRVFLHPGAYAPFI